LFLAGCTKVWGGRSKTDWASTAEATHSDKHNHGKREVCQENKKRENWTYDGMKKDSLGQNVGPKGVVHVVISSQPGGKKEFVVRI